MHGAISEKGTFSMQKGLEISITDMLRQIAKKWPTVLACVLLCAAAANFHGYRQAVTSAENEQKQLEMLAAQLGTAVEDIPDYYTLELAELRAALNEQEAAFSEAAAKMYMYRVWASDVINRELVIGEPDEEDYRIVQTLYYATEGVQAAVQTMTSAQKSYYNILVRNLSGLDIPVQSKELSSPGLIQTRWLFIGAVLGLLLGCCIVAFSYMLSSRLRTAKDMESPFGVPVLGTAGKKSTADAEAVAKGLIRLLREKNRNSLAVASVNTPEAEKLSDEISKAMTAAGVRVIQTKDENSFVNDIAEADAVLFVEQTGKSRYAVIDKNTAACRNFNVPVAGCLVLES